MEFRRKGAEIVVNLTQGPPENSCRPAVDVMFRSALDVYGPNLLAVVMTGMGHDGAAGAKEIHDRGGRVLIHPQQPLTARVMVNRIWYHHFGTGLVKTLENFGVQGERPSHPELLDWLAVEFIQRGWSIKEMHRLMMQSRTVPAVM